MPGWARNRGYDSGCYWACGQCAAMIGQSWCCPACGQHEQQRMNTNRVSLVFMEGGRQARKACAIVSSCSERPWAQSKAQKPIQPMQQVCWYAHLCCSLSSTWPEAHHSASPPSPASCKCDRWTTCLPSQHTHIPKSTHMGGGDQAQGVWSTLATLTSLFRPGIMAATTKEAPWHRPRLPAVLGIYQCF